MNRIIDKSAGLNLQGVEMMVSGDDRKARILFLDAIRMTTKLMDENTIVSRVSEQTHFVTTEQNQNHSMITLPATAQFISKKEHAGKSGNTIHAKSSKTPLSRSFSSPCECTEFELRRTTNGGDFYFYNQAVVFYPTPLLESESDIANVDLTFYSAVIMFNLALCHHMRGIRIGKNTLLRKARVLYRKCSQLMKQYLGFVGGVHFLLIAACNNQAHICYELADAASFHVHLSEVKKLISKHNHMLTMKNEFFLNVLISPHLFCAAPSA